MSSEPDCIPTERLSALLDGELPPAEAASALAHVESCAECAAAREALRSLRTSLRALADVAAPRAVWARIEAAHDGRASARALRASWWRRPVVLPLAAFAGAAAAVALVFFAAPSQRGEEPAHRREGDPSGPPSDLAKAPRQRASAAVAVAKAESAYRAAIDGLKAVLGPARAKWSPKARAAVERSLAEIDRAVDRCRAAVRTNPDDVESQEAMMAAYQQKVELLTELAEGQGT